MSQQNDQLFDMIHQLAGEDGPALIVEGVIVIADIMTEGGGHGLFTATTDMPPYRALGMLQSEMISVQRVLYEHPEQQWGPDVEQ
jgi:hypothetical protein